MIKQLREFMNRVRHWIYQHKPQSISRQSAVGVSIIFHVFLATAFASYYMTITDIEHQSAPADPIVFDLETDTDLHFDSQESKSNLAKQEAGTQSQDAAKGDPLNVDESASAGKGSPSANVSKREVMLSSLASLSELRDSFRFVMQNVAADSLNGISPLVGDAPDTDLITAGFKEGDGYGNGHGGGVIVISGGGGACPAPGILR